MADDARAEGFTELALKFEFVAKVEAAHEKRYLKLLDSLKNLQEKDLLEWKVK